MTGNQIAVAVPPNPPRAGGANGAERRKKINYPRNKPGSL